MRTTTFADTPCMYSILGVGLKGIHSGLQQAQESAQKITESFSLDAAEDAVKPIIDLAQAQRQVEASTKIIKVGDQILGSVLDILG